MYLSSEFATKVYDILIIYAGAWDNIKDHREKESFIYSHNHKEQWGACDEWRFQGWLGFGGKYRSNSNSVDYYSEDKSEERDKIVEETNYQLTELKKKYIKCEHYSFYLQSTCMCNYSKHYGCCSHVEEMLEGKKITCKDYKER